MLLQLQIKEFTAEHLNTPFWSLLFPIALLASYGQYLIISSVDPCKHIFPRSIISMKYIMANNYQGALTIRSYPLLSTVGQPGAQVSQ